MQRRVDDAITEKFAATLREAESGGLDGWRAASPSSAVALVILLDQFTRHVYRHHADRDARVAANDAVAVTVTERCLELGWDARVTVPQQVFLLMPFRHTHKSIPRLRRALDALDARREADAARADLLGKFRRTTLRCLQDMEGKQHRAGDEILEFHEFTPSQEAMAVMAEHPVYRTVERFLRAKLHLAGGGGGGGDDERRDAQSRQSRERPVRSVAVSLSGGVDSMARSELGGDTRSCSYKRINSAVFV